MVISIITASYNSAATIRDTMDSVLRQTYSNFEYIVKDGGSTDGTIDIIKEYEPKFHGRMKWVSGPDKGIYDAMNKGIAMATGDVVGILNSDDFYTNNNVLEKIENAFDDNTDAVYGDIHFIRQDNPSKIARYYSSKMFRPFWLRFGFMPAHPGFYLKREVYKETGEYNINYKLASDFDMMVRLFHESHIRAKYIPLDIVTMRMGGASTSGVRSHKMLLKEDVDVCLSHGIYTNRLLVALKYLYKAFEFRL